MTDKEWLDAVLKVASFYALRTATAAACSGSSIDEAVFWFTIVLHRLPCMLGLALALLELWQWPRKRRGRRRRLSLSDICHDATLHSIDWKFKLGFDGSY